MTDERPDELDGSDESAGSDGSDGSDEPATDDGEQDTPARPETDWQRRKRLAAVFGDVLPDTTRDERGEPDRTSDEWYRSQRPPHHGG